MPPSGCGETSQLDVWPPIGDVCRMNVYLLARSIVVGKELNVAWWMPFVIHAVTIEAWSYERSEQVLKRSDLFNGVNGQ
jgi:hypothetical protein